MSASGPDHRPWVGTVLSVLVPGAGLFLAGRRRAGAAWLIGLIALGLLGDVLGPLPCLPGVWHIWSLDLAQLILWFAMLVHSWRRVPRLGGGRWLCVVLLCPALYVGSSVVGAQLIGLMAAPSHSMQPTIQGASDGPQGLADRGDVLLIQKTAYWFNEPHRGDVVVFRSDGMKALIQDTHYLKRVVGLPGERIRFEAGRLLVGGTRVVDPPVFDRLRFDPPPFAGTFLGVGQDYTVPPGSYFVVGDNSTNSHDSRAFGPVPASKIIGRATKIIWPLSRAGDIR